MYYFVFVLFFTEKQTEYIKKYVLESILCVISYSAEEQESNCTNKE